MMDDRYLEGVRAGLEAAAKVCEDRGVTLALDGMVNGTACGIRIASAIRSIDPETLK